MAKMRTIFIVLIIWNSVSIFTVHGCSPQPSTGQSSTLPSAIVILSPSTRTPKDLFANPAIAPSNAINTNPVVPVVPAPAQTSTVATVPVPVPVVPLIPVVPSPVGTAVPVGPLVPVVPSPSVTSETPVGPVFPLPVGTPVSVGPLVPVVPSSLVTSETPVVPVFPSPVGTAGPVVPLVPSPASPLFPLFPSPVQSTPFPLVTSGTPVVSLVPSPVFPLSPVLPSSSPQVSSGTAVGPAFPTPGTPPLFPLVPSGTPLGPVFPVTSPSTNIPIVITAPSQSTLPTGPAGNRSNPVTSVVSNVTQGGVRQNVVTGEQAVQRDTCSGAFGITIGGRCFYVLNNSYEWSDAWGACRRQRGVLAQIMTSGELRTIAAYLMDRLSFQMANGSVWVALRRNDSATGASTFMPSNSTYWYDANDQPNVQLTVGNTWVRNRTNDDTVNPSDSCIELWRNYSAFGDNSCSQRIPALCQISDPNTGMQFESVSNTCLSETPIEQLSINDQSICQSTCRSRGWCRSYNVVNTTQCQLFPWTTVDQPASAASPGQSCQFFQYVP